MKTSELDWVLLGIMIVVAGLGFIAGFSTAMVRKGVVEYNLDTGGFSTWEVTSTVACTSNSMGVTLNCHDKIFMKEVNNDSLIPGRIYTYDRGNLSIVHRFIMCLDEGCNQLVFKGDANRKGEIVNRSQVEYEVVRTEYKG